MHRDIIFQRIAKSHPASVGIFLIYTCEAIVNLIEQGSGTQNVEKPYWTKKNQEKLQKMKSLIEGE